MVHLYPQVTKSSDLFDVESAFKGATQNQQDKKKEPVENGGKRKKAEGGNDKKSDDCTRQCIKIFGYLIPFILLLSIGAYLGYNYEKKIHELTEANRKCEAQMIEQGNSFNRAIAEYDQRNMDYGDYYEQRLMREKFKKEDDELRDANDKIDYDGYAETNGPVSEPRTKTRIVHISTKGADGKYGFSFIGTTIYSVKLGWPAEALGVKAGDEIVSIDGEKVETEDDVNRLGWKETGITLELRSKDVVPRPATRFVDMVRSDVSMWQSIYGFYHRGTTITDVVRGSPMEQNGVKARDEIVSIDRIPVHSHDDVKRQIQGKNYVIFEIRPHS